MSQHRALELLRQAAAALEKGATPCATSSSTMPRVNSTGATAPLATDRIASAVRSIFQPFTNRTGTRSSVSARRNPTAAGSGRSYWTHRFCVLGRISDTTAPTREEKDRLYKANLGEKKIVLEKNSSADYLKNSLEEQYPKLLGIGGFELCRSQTRSRLELEVIRMPPGGYNVNFLANHSNLGQAVCFICPIQKNLSVEAEEDVSIQ